MNVKILLNIVLFLIMHNVVFTSNLKSFRLTNGEEIQLLSSDMIESDWNNDFEKTKKLLLRHRKISDFLDVPVFMEN